MYARERRLVKLHHHSIQLIRKNEQFYLSYDSRNSAEESLAEEREGPIARINCIPQILVTDDPNRSVEEVPDDRGRQALVEAEKTLPADDVGGDAEGGSGSGASGGGGGGEGLAVELEARLGEVYGECGRFSDHGRERREQDLRGGSLAGGGGGGGHVFVVVLDDSGSCEIGSRGPNRTESTVKLFHI